MHTLLCFAIPNRKSTYHKSDNSVSLRLTSSPLHTCCQTGEKGEDFQREMWKLMRNSPVCVPIPWDRSVLGAWDGGQWSWMPCLQDLILVTYSSFKVFRMRLTSISHIQLQTKRCHWQLKKYSPHPTASVCAYHWTHSLANTALLKSGVSEATLLHVVDARSHDAAEDPWQSRWMDQEGQLGWSTSGTATKAHHICPHSLSHFSCRQGR